MSEEKNLTYEDLGRFTEETFLPAIEKIFDYKLEIKLEEKIRPMIREELKPIKEELIAIKEQLKKMEKQEREDVGIVYKDFLKLKERISILEEQVKKFETRSA